MELNEKLIELRSKITDKERIKRKLSDAKSELNALNKQREILKKKLIKEEVDVKKLESLSFVNLWHSFIGDKTTKLQEEKIEFYQAQSDYNTLCNTISLLQDEITNYERGMDDVRHLEEEYEQLLTEKEKLLIDSNPEVNQLHHEIIRYNNQNKEIHEAISAGNAYLRSLNRIKKTLNSAKNWGTYDLLGGGLIATMAKHSHLDEAQSHIKSLKYVAQRFSRELKDVNLSFSINIDISDTLRFADWFFDGFIVDITVQSRINDALSKVSNNIYSVEPILRTLDIKQRECNQLLEEANSKLRSILESN